MRAKPANVESLLVPQERARLPFARQVLLYLDPLAFFKDASSGPEPVRERALSYNRAMRRRGLSPARVFAMTAASRKLASLTLVAVLAACATAQDVEEAEQSWFGASFEDVMRAWGAPNRSTKTPDGRDWHTWVSESYSQPGSSVGVGIGGMSVGRRSGVGVGVGVGVPIGSPPPPERCERTLIFADGRVAEQHWNGPPSLCVDFKRK